MNYNKAKFEKACGAASQLPAPQGSEIVFCGKSNVGKSSLLNKLFSRKALAKVSAVPGKTITINFYDVDGVKFVDLPGYGYAKISKSEKARFSALIETYFRSERPVRLVVVLIDMRHPPTAGDLDMLHYVQETKMPYIVVLTKSDKLNKTEYKARLNSLPGELGCPESVAVIAASSKNGQGIDEIKQHIETAVEKGE